METNDFFFTILHLIDIDEKKIYQQEQMMDSSFHLPIFDVGYNVSCNSTRNRV